MLNLNLVLKELKNNFPKEFTDFSKSKRGNILYDIFSNPKIRNIQLNNHSQTYTLWLNDKCPYGIFLSLTRLNDNKTVYSLDFNDNRNFSCILHCDTMEINISSKTITKKVKRIKQACEEINMSFKRKKESLSLKYIMGDSLKGTYDNLLSDGTKIHIKLNYSLSECRISTCQKMRITTKDGKRYLGDFFIDNFDKKLYIHSFYLNDNSGISDNMHQTKECEDIINKYLAPYIYDLVSLFITQDAIQKICDLLANPNNLPFEVV